MRFQVTEPNTYFIITGTNITMVSFTCILRYVSVLLVTVVALRAVTEMLAIRRDDDNKTFLATSSSWKNHSSGTTHFRAFSANPKHHNTSVTGQALPVPFTTTSCFCWVPASLRCTMNTIRTCMSMFLDFLETGLFDHGAAKESARFLHVSTPTILLNGHCTPMSNS